MRGDTQAVRLLRKEFKVKRENLFKKTKQNKQKTVSQLSTQRRKCAVQGQREGLACLVPIRTPFKSAMQMRNERCQNLQVLIGLLLVTSHGPEPRSKIGFLVEAGAYEVELVALPQRCVWHPTLTVISKLCPGCGLFLEQTHQKMMLSVIRCKGKLTLRWDAPSPHKTSLRAGTRRSGSASHSKDLKQRGLPSLTGAGV